MTRLFHSIACTDTECDPPREVEHSPQRSNPRTYGQAATLTLDGCPIGDPEVVLARRGDDGEVVVVLRRSFVEVGS